MKAILLAGGLGTRMREETEFRPKPMVDIGGRPVLWHIMKRLSHFGVYDFIVAAGYKGDMIKKYFLNYEAWNSDFTVELGRKNSLILHNDHDESNWTVTVADTGQETLTGGRVLHASRYLSDEQPFIVAYGDGLADIDVSALVETHQASGKTTTVTAFQPASRFGVMDVDSEGTVTRFKEKPRLEGWINIGFFVMEPEALSYLDPECALEDKPLLRMAEANQLGAYHHKGFWQPMDTYREYKALNDLWASGEAPWASFG